MKKWIILSAIPLVIIAATLLFVFSFSLQVGTLASPEPEAPRSKTGYIFLLPVELKSFMHLPILFQDVEVTDLSTREVLDPTIYIYDQEDMAAIHSCGFYTKKEFFENFSKGLYQLNAQELHSNWMCVFLVFNNIPPQDHPLRITVCYKLFGIFQKEKVIDLEFKQQ